MLQPRFVLLAVALLPAASAMTTPAPKSNVKVAPTLRASRNAGLRIAAGAALGNILQGFNTGVIGGALLYIVPEFGLEARPGVTGLIASSTTMGATLGTVACAKLLQDLGRQRTLVISCALFTLGGAIMGLAPGTSTLILGRIVSGVAAGLVSAAVPTYIAECAEPSQRGALSTLPQLCVSSGILISYLVGLAALLFGGSWRLMLAFSLLPALAQACFVLALPESPRWLLSRRDDAPAALEALKRLRGTEDVGAEFAAMQAGLAKEGARDAEDRAEKTATTARGGGVLALLRNPAARRALLVCSSLQLFQQFCGVNAIVYFTPQILKQAGAPSLFLSWGVSTNAAAMLATVLAYLPKIPAVLLATYLIDRRHAAPTPQAPPSPAHLHTRLSRLSLVAHVFLLGYASAAAAAGCSKPLCRRSPCASPSSPPPSVARAGRRRPPPSRPPARRWRSPCLESSLACLSGRYQTSWQPSSSRHRCAAWAWRRRPQCSG